MRVLVCGSRDWTDRARIWQRLRLLEPETVVVHGAARGADLMAAEIARVLGLGVDPFPADWNVTMQTRPEMTRERRDGSLYDAEAGFRRNIAMLESGVELVIAFQRAFSGGTQHTIDQARKRGIPVEVIHG